MHLFSRYKLLDPQVEFLVTPDNPSIVTGVQLPSGDQFTFIGLHPRPPARDQSALFRDAELMHAAMAAHGDARPVVLAGDLNSVP